MKLTNQEKINISKYFIIQYCDEEIAEKPFNQLTEKEILYYFDNEIMNDFDDDLELVIHHYEYLKTIIPNELLEKYF